MHSFTFLTAKMTIGLINYVYPPGSLHNNVAGDFLDKRAILATTNHGVASINDCIVRDRMTGQLKFKLSADVPVERADRDVVGPEILNGVENASLPPHSLCLKVSCPVMCLRNLDPVNGLCNGTRLQVNYIGNHFLQCTILGGKHRGKVHLLPQISLQSPDNDARCPYSFKRAQFPVRLAYAMKLISPKVRPWKRLVLASSRRFSATVNYIRAFRGLSVAMACA
jgi:ATP-dependent DNA helicase PIF1